ncbi:anti-sigma factor family protein [Luteibacter yeojuensis]|uniref:anti-sigma factor family protein n=1 Tax=Luteibacter yeojuensis TaxID=345309 RepID=UPI000A00272D|nr:zf-HC2 domain-containing protein [Luteibacter yeojuensis]
MDCKTASDLLPLYFDGELDRATSRGFEAHVDACPACRDALVALDALRQALRHEAPRFDAPGALRARVIASAAGMPTPEARQFRVALRPWMAMAASLLLAFVAGGAALAAWQRASSASAVEAQQTRDLFASHWRALAATSPIDVVSTDQHTVKPWFAGKVATAPVVRDFKAEGYALIGGRIDYVGNDRVPVLVYQHGKHLVDVFILPGGGVASDGSPVQMQGYVLERAMLGGQAVAIVSDMDRAELTRFRDLLDSQVQGD